MYVRIFEILKLREWGLEGECGEIGLELKK